MTQVLRPDLCVVGAGSGGLSVAAAARALGASVVLVERDRMGGDCLNYGCVPSKALIAAAKRAHTIQHASRFGVSASELKVNFGRVHQHVRDVIDSIAPHDSVERFEGLGATVIKAHGRFLDRTTLAAGDVQVKARRFVIATGSSPFIPPVPGLDQVEYLTNETIFSMTRKPAHLLVIGGGPIGMELAQAHRRLGCEVSVVEMFDPLGKDDPELAAIALRKIAAEGVNILGRTAVKSVEARGQGVALDVEADGETRTITGSHLLVAAGRQVNISDLGLEAAGIRLAGRAIGVTPGMRTSNRRVYAIGDVAGGLQFTHMAGYHAGLVIRNALFGLPVRQDTSIIPWATYTDPELANVGMTEAEARKKLGERFRVLRATFAENDRARAERRTEGVVKLIVAPNGKILGAGIVGAGAGELISFFAYAMANRMKVSSLTRFVAPYPTISEIVKRVAYAFYAEQADNVWLGRLRRLVAKLP